MVLNHRAFTLHLSTRSRAFFHPRRPFRQIVVTDRVSSHSPPPGACVHVYRASRVQRSFPLFSFFSRCSSIVIDFFLLKLTRARAFRSSFFHPPKKPLRTSTSMRSVGLELTTLTLVGTRFTPILITRYYIGDPSWFQTQQVLLCVRFM